MKELHLQYHKETGTRIHQRLQNFDKSQHDDIWEYILWLEKQIEDAEKTIKDLFQISGEAIQHAIDKL